MSYKLVATAFDSQFPHPPMTTLHLRSLERNLLRLFHHRRRTLHRHHLTEIYGHVLRHYLHYSNALLSHFVSVCSSLSHISFSARVFRQCPYPNILLFNSAIKANSLSVKFSLESVVVFERMRSMGVYPDRFTFAPLLKACSNLLDLELGRGAHAGIIVAGLEFHQNVQIGLVELYSVCQQMNDACQLFDVMSSKSVIAWNLIIRGFCCRGGDDDLENAHRFFCEMTERSVVTWNTMIRGFAHGGRESEALDLFKEMWDLGFKPDDATLVTVLPLCARLGSLDVGRWIHSYADRKEFIKNTIHVGNSVLDMYCKCGDLQSAITVFGNMPMKNVVSWNTMILGYAFNGKGQAGVYLFEKMKKQGVVPNAASFLGALVCCTHAGLVYTGQVLFKSMIKEHGIEAGLEHYGCMVDLLGRSGHVEEAADLIRGMPMKPNATIWGSLLSSSTTHGNSVIATYAAKELIDIEPWNSANYVLLSNIYSEAGQWDDVEKVRQMMMENNVIKSPGQSLVESK